MADEISRMENVSSMEELTSNLGDQVLSQSMISAVNQEESDYRPVSALLA